jgi:hypothetical protein
MKSVFQNSKTSSPALPKSLWVFTIMLSFVFVSHAPSAGPRILFSSTRDGNPEIYTMNPDGSNVVNLSRHPRADRDPTWSPDGKKIGFISARIPHHNELSCKPVNPNLLGFGVFQLFSGNHPQDLS